jgi:nitrite reductase/ring-hydroxylating ferredoxin subunit
MTKMVAGAELTAMVRDSIEHAKAGTIAKTPGILKLPASRYYDPGQFKLEVDKIFKRVPLMLAASSELAKPGDYKTITAVGMPILIVRGQDNVVRAFINSCSHRGTNVAVEPYGNTKRFMCPYHGWTFTQKGELMGVASPGDFGEIDKSCYGLTPLPVAERAGLVWVIVNPKSDLSIDDFLSGYDKLLANFGFETWHYFSSRVLAGPNWKIAYDGYLDFYHLPVLHRNTFGEDMFNQALFYAWGPHQVVRAPTANLIEMDAVPEDQWSNEDVMSGVWTIFPHISIASFGGGGRGVMVSQLLPGEKVGESFTTQMYLTQDAPTEQMLAEVDAQFKFLEVVVRDEDYATGLRQQKALEAGAREFVLFGENEGGARRFHQWVDTLVAADDEQLKALFKPGAVQPAS